MTAIPARLTVPVRYRTNIILYGLVAFCFVVGWFTATMQRVHTVSHTIEVPAKITSGAEAARALGKPDAVVDGAQVNPQFQGLTCAVYQSKHAVLCYAP